MRVLRFHLIFAGYCGLLYGLLVGLMVWLFPFSSTTYGMIEAALLPGFVVGEILRLPPAGLHQPHVVALFVGVIGQGFLLGLFLSVLVSAGRPASRGQ